MPLTLVLGPANSAKAGELFAAYGAAAHRGALLVVPNARDAEHYSRELAERGSVLGSVLTFGGLAEEIARRAGYAARRLTALQREQVVESAVAEARLSSLARAAETGGFATAAGEMIAELERSMVTPQRFARAMARWADEAAGSARPREAYASEVAAIYFAYAKELERLGRVDSELFAWHALDALRATPGRWGNDAVFFYGFDDLHPLQRDAVETLARLVGVEVMVSLTYEAGRGALQVRAEIVEELRPLAERVVELPAVDDYYAPPSREVLHYLERRLFQPGAVERRPEPGGAVRLLESAGERAEAELIAAEVLGLLAEGIPGDEFAVVYRSLPAAAPALMQALGRYGIRVAVERRIAVGHAALGRGLLALARCALLEEGEASAQDLLDYLRTPGLLRRPELADALEFRIRREGLTTALQARERTELELGEIDALRSAADPAGELAHQGRRLLAAPHRGDAALLTPEEELDAQALTAYLRAVDELEDLGARLSGRDLIRLLERIEVDASVRESSGAVVLSEPLAIRARRFRAVIIGGLQEGEFPRTPSPDPFLPDELRRELAVASGLRLAQREDALERERYLFYAAVSRATEHVLLSYRSSDEEGNLQLASPFVDDVAELLAEDWLDQRRRRLLGDLVWPIEHAPTARELERARVVEAGAGAFRPAPAAAWAPRLAGSTLAEVRHTEVVSAGALETYADCPIKWLVERELRPERLEPESEPIVRGSYMHDVLERVLNRLGRAVTPESLPQALQILDELVAETPPELAPGRPEPLRRATAEQIAADLRRYLRHEAATGCGWAPYGLELRFGFTEDDEQSALPALELGEGSERIAVRGAIDRVDLEPGGRRAVVRDYKSGGSRQEHQAGRWGTERRLQVALYMIAVRDLMGLEPVAGLYQPLRGRDLRARGVFLDGEAVGGSLVATDARDPGELEAELEGAADRAVALAARLRSGDLEPCPETCSRDGCMYPGICRAT
jgi:ATP-dependent helicase/DNAse subunit B